MTDDPRDDARALRLIQQFDRRIPELLERDNVPGLSIALVRDGRLRWDGAFGVRSRETGELVTPGTVFEAASLSKPVLSYMVFGLRRRGAIDLDRPLGDYMDEPYVPNDPRAERITARHVLSHTSGLPNWRSEKQPLRTSFEPGTRFSYSGEGYVYLGKVIERIVGVPIADALDAWMREPLGFDAGTFLWSNCAGQDVAVPHDANGEPHPKAEWPRINVAASLHCSARAFAQLLCALVRPDGSGPPNMVPDEVAEMLTPQVRLNDRVGWALGWGIQRSPGGEAFWHWGDNSGYRGFAIGSVTTGHGLAVLTNGENGQRVIDAALREIVFGGDVPALDWLARLYGG